MLINCFSTFPVGAHRIWCHDVQKMYGSRVRRRECELQCRMSSGITDKSFQQLFNRFFPLTLDVLVLLL